MKEREFTSAKAKEALLPDIKEELERLEENEPDRQRNYEVGAGKTTVSNEV